CCISPAMEERDMEALTCTRPGDLTIHGPTGQCLKTSAPPSTLRVESCSTGFTATRDLHCLPPLPAATATATSACICLTTRSCCATPQLWSTRSNPPGNWWLPPFLIIRQPHR